MTNQEAIELLNQEEVPMMLNGKNNENLVVAHIKAIEALEKQVPKKAVEIRRKHNFRGDVILLVGCCPGCDSELDSTYRYCKSCGSSLDWSVEE